MSDPITLTMADGAAFVPGDVIRIGPRPRWYARLWRWVTRKKDPNVYVVTAVVANAVFMEAPE